MIEFTDFDFDLFPEANLLSDAGHLEKGNVAQSYGDVEIVSMNCRNFHVHLLAKIVRSMANCDLEHLSIEDKYISVSKYTNLIVYLFDRS